MKFLIDNQLPVALAEHLRNRGEDCVHVQERGMDASSDAVVWQWASKEECIVVSKDEDFVYLAHRPDDAGRLIWIRLGNCRNHDLCRAFDRVLAEMKGLFASGQRVVELR